MDKIKLYQKIAAVMSDVEYLAKDDQIKFGSTNYKAISEEKVTRTVRESLIKNKLIIIPVEQEHSKDGNLSTVNTKYKIIDTETGEYETIVSSGTGADTQDKGVGKAMTYAYKYLLLRTFAIPTGEDPDKVSSAELDAKQNQPQSNGNKASDKQMKYLNSLIKDVAKKYGYTESESVGKLKGRMETPKSLDEYTSTDAKKAIDILKTALEAQAS